MAGDAMEKDWLKPWIREQIRGSCHLFHGRARPLHRHDLPSDTGLSDDLRLVDVLGICGVDRAQGHDCLDSFATDDPVQGHRVLPASSHQSAGDDYANALLGVTFRPNRGAYGGSHCDHDCDPHSEAIWDRKTHERVISQRQRSHTAPPADRRREF
jgi:hypothetical protein